MFYFDFGLLDWIQLHLRSGVGDFWMPLITHLGDHGFLWLVLAAILLILPRTRRAGLAVLLAIGLSSLVVCGLIKPFVGRLRPCDLNPALPLLIARPTDFSFPSGHTAAGFSSVTALFFCNSSLWRWFALPAALIAFSRLYLYVHFPTDILAGLLLGILSGWAGAALVQLPLALKRKGL